MPPGRQKGEREASSSELPEPTTTFFSHPGIVAQLLASLGGTNTLSQDTRRLLWLDPALVLHTLGWVASHHPHALLSDLYLPAILDDLPAEPLKQKMLTCAVAQLAQHNGTDNDASNKACHAAVATAALSRAIAEALHYGNPDEAWLAGLLSHLPAFAAQGTPPETARIAALMRMERLPLRSFLPDVVRYLNEPAARLVDAAPLVRYALAAHRLTVQQASVLPDKTPFEAGLDEVSLLHPLSSETLSRMLQNAHQTADHLTASLTTPQSGEIAAEVTRFGRLEAAANSAGEEIEQAIAALASSLAAEEGLYDPLYLALNKRTSTLVAHAINGVTPPPISLRVEGSNTAAVRALFTRSCVVVYAKGADTAVLDLQLIRQAKAEGLAAIPVGEGEHRGVLLVCGDRDALEKLAAAPAHYTRLGELAGRTVAPSIIVETGNGGPLDALPGRVRRAAHEVNNPLGIIKNYLAILKVKLGDDAPISDELRIIHEELDRIVRIVRGMLHEDVEMAELDEDTDINMLLEDMVKVTAPTWHAKGVHMKTELAPGLPRLSQDRDKLKQIVLNLLLNALEATPEGGSVRLETAAVTNQRRERFLEILVADSGPGIAPDRAEALFDSVESEKGDHHAGLGLAIVKTLADSLQGSITFKSTASGTTFQVSLPLGETPKEPHKEQQH